LSCADITMQTGNGQFPWFALRVKSRHEHNVSAALSGKGYEWFLPLYKSRRAWSDRIKEIQLPLFPGYVFCRFDPQYRLPILTTPGVAGIVGTSRRPIPIDESEITALQAAVHSGLPNYPWPFLQIGRRVRLECGPLRGLEGILVDFKGAHRLVLSVALLKRSVAVEVDSAWVISIPSEDWARPTVVIPQHQQYRFIGGDTR